MGIALSVGYNDGDAVGIWEALGEIDGSLDGYWVGTLDGCCDTEGIAEGAQLPSIACWNSPSLSAINTSIPDFITCLRSSTSTALLDSIFTTTDTNPQR